MPHPSFSRWRLPYLLDRFQLWRWEKSNPGCPWLAQGAIQLLDQYLQKSDVILETGSGRSTIWFARRVHTVHSLEHHGGWHAQVSKMMQQQDISNVIYHLESNAFSAQPSDSPYVQCVQNMPDQHFDMVLVDGKHRGDIAMLALDKVKPGGIIVIDNVERYLPLHIILHDTMPNPEHPGAAWAAFGEKTQNFRRATFNNGITATMVLFVPPTNA